MCAMAKAKTTPKKKKLVSMRFCIGDNEYKSDGETVLEALQNIKPKNYLGYGSVYLTLADKESAIPLRINKYKLERIFSNATDLALFAKRLETLA